MVLTNDYLIKVNGLPVDGEQPMQDAGAIVGTVSTPGTDSNFPTEKAVRDAITAAAGTDENVKSDATDPVAGYLDSKVDATTIEVDTVTHKQRVKDDGITTAKINILNYLRYNASAGKPGAAVEGYTWWDAVYHCLAYQTDQPGVVNQIGQEDHSRVWNPGAEIGNAKVVALPDTVTAGIRDISLADIDASDFEGAIRNVFGLTTHVIGANSGGIVTSRGLVGDTDTSAWPVGTELYASTTPGELTDTRPLTPARQISVGMVTVQHASEGIIAVDLHEQSWVGGVQSSSDAHERTGFILNFSHEAVDSAGNTLIHTVDAVARTYTLSSVSGTIPTYSSNNYMPKTGDQVWSWTDVEGTHYFTYDESGVIQTTTTPPLGLIEGPTVFVAALTWDATNKEIIGSGVLIETHGIQMSGATHRHFHDTLGARAKSGLSISDLVVDGDGTNAVDSQFGVEAGQISDDDIWHSIDAIASTVGLTVVTNENMTTDTRQFTRAGYSVLRDTDVGTGTTNRLVYNYWNGTTWSYVTASVNDFVLCHVLAVGQSGDMVYAAMGQNEYSSTTDARDGAETEMANLVTTLPYAEIRPIATVIFQTGAYGSRVRPFSATEDYVDWRESGVTAASGFTATDHSNLTGRSDYGSHPSSAIQYQPATTLTISSGVVTYAQPTHIIASEGGGVDDLVTITPPTSDNYRLRIWADATDVVTLKHGTGNILTRTGTDQTITDGKALDLFYNGTNWMVTSFDAASPGAIGGTTPAAIAGTTGTFSGGFQTTSLHVYNADASANSVSTLQNGDTTWWAGLRGDTDGIYGIAEGSGFALQIAKTTHAATFAGTLTNKGGQTWQNTVGTQIGSIDNDGALSINSPLYLGDGTIAPNILFRNYNDTNLSWVMGVRSDVGGANQDLKFLRYAGGTSYQGIALQIANSTGNATFSGSVETTSNFKTTNYDSSTGIRTGMEWTSEAPYLDVCAYIKADRTAVADAPMDIVMATGTASGGVSERLRIDSTGNATFSGNITSQAASGVATPVLKLWASGVSSVGDGGAVEFQHSGGERSARVRAYATSTNAGDLILETGAPAGGYDEVLRLTGGSKAATFSGHMQIARSGGSVTALEVQGNGTNWIQSWHNGVGASVGYVDNSGNMTANGWLNMASVQTTASGTGGSDSAGSGNQYVKLTIAGATYKLLHDGTI